MVDFTQFFNPSAWGSWAPPGMQGFLGTQAQNSPNAPVPSGAMTPPPNPPAIPGASMPAATGPASPMGNIIQKLMGGAGGQAPGQAPPGYTGPTGNIGYGTGVGATGPIPATAAPDPAATSRNQGVNSLLQQSALGMLQPQQMQAPQIQMARPVGPGQMPQQGMSSAGSPMSGIVQAAANQGYPGMLNRFGF